MDPAKTAIFIFLNFLLAQHIVTIGANSERPSDTLIAFNELISNSTVGFGVCEFLAQSGLTLELAETPSISEISDLPFTPDQLIWFNSLHPTFQTRPKPLVRKEIRYLTKEELTDYHNAIWSLKMTSSSNNEFSKYQTFTDMHFPMYGPAQDRAGPATTGWHREFLLRFEEALLRENPKLVLPYVDLSLENMASPSDSVLWGDTLFGECNSKKEDGDVTAVQVSNGPYAQWPASSYCGGDNVTLSRACAVGLYKYLPYSDVEMALLVNFTSYKEMYKQTFECFVCDHDNIHAFLLSGASVESNKLPNPSEVDKRCVVDEPASWPIHTFLDYIFEQFRMENEKVDPETDYPDDGDISDYFHRADTEMYPFKIKNIDGISTDYTDYFYRYFKKKTACAEDNDCGGSDQKLIFCNQNSRCVSRVRTGSECTENNMCVEGDYCSSKTKICKNISV